MSISGGVELSLVRGRETGCEAIQIFTKSSSQWKARTLPEDEVARFHRTREKTGIGTVVAHASYLINLGSPDPDLWERSIGALEVELERCDLLGVSDLVVHPGAHVGSGEARGLQRIRRALDRILKGRPPEGARICLETTAGQGTCLGHRFEHLARILDKSRYGSGIGFCLDTCHLLAAGYEIRTAAGYRQTMDRFESLVGLVRVRVVHVNDSRKDLGSRVDRHEQIGKGFIGSKPFGRFLNDSRLAGLPFILETPKGKDPVRNDRKNLAALRRLLASRKGS